MINFKEYFILNEAPFFWTNPQPDKDKPSAPIPVENLGLDKSGILPDEKPYGFWVDKSGNFKAVYDRGPKNTGGHAGAAKEIILSAIKYKDKHGGMTQEEEDGLTKALTSFKGLYRVLELANFLHIVLAGNTYHYYTADKGMVTTSQQRFLDKLAAEYGTEIQYASGIF